MKATALRFSFFQITHPIITVTYQLPRREHSHFSRTDLTFHQIRGGHENQEGSLGSPLKVKSTEMEVPLRLLVSYQFLFLLQDRSLLIPAVTVRIRSHSVLFENNEWNNNVATLPSALHLGYGGQLCTMLS